MRKKIKLDYYIKYFKMQFPELAKYIDHDFNKVKIKDRGFIAFLLKLTKYRGICFFRRIYFVKGIFEHPEFFRILAHELTHTIQYRREGIFNFLRHYIYEIIKKGYKKNKYEEEADYHDKMFVIWCKKENVKSKIMSDLPKKSHK